MIAVTGATGQLGRLVIESLLDTVDPGTIAAAVRSPEKAADLARLGVQVRHADYDQADTLQTAFAGVERLLLVSSNEVGGRLPQHRAAIDAAKAAGVALIVYTSILHADRSPAKLAVEHRATEALLAASGLATIVLRNGWYTENYLLALQPALQHGAMLGASRDGRISLAARADYAEAAACALTSDGQSRVYELAGDTAWSLTEFAAEIARQSGRTVAYRDMPQAEYQAALLGAGLPAALADVLADAEARAADGALYDESHALSRLIARPTTPVEETVAAAVARAG